MTTFRDIFQSTYICAEDLKGRDHTLTIKSIDFEAEVWRNGKKERAIALHFAEARKGLVLNVTNHDVIAFKLGYGKQLEEWVGKAITIYPTTDNRVRGDDKDVVRVRPTVPKPKAEKPAPAAEPQPESGLVTPEP